MKKAQILIPVLVLLAATACAPVYNDAAYYEHVEPVSRVSVGSFSHTPYRYEHLHGAIEVALFADHTYLGLNFQPVHLVIHDGDYVRVPLRNKRGHLKVIYAHYHKGDLHFDASKSCRNIAGTSRFRYDKGWEEGRRYDYISAGPDYDLRGYRLSVRKHNAGKSVGGNNISRYATPKTVSGKSQYAKPERVARTVFKLKSRPGSGRLDAVRALEPNNAVVQKKQASRAMNVVKHVSPKGVLFKEVASTGNANSKNNIVKAKKSVTYDKKGNMVNIYKGKQGVVKGAVNSAYSNKNIAGPLVNKNMRTEKAESSDVNVGKKLVASEKKIDRPGKRSLQEVPHVEVDAEPTSAGNSSVLKKIKRNKSNVKQSIGG